MTVDPITNAVQLTPEEVRKAVALYLRQQHFNIRCRPQDVKVEPSGAEVVRWDNKPQDVLDEEELFLINQ